jgi:peptidoglycan/LPS O-acetylase OafA/YrhL
MRNRLRRNGPLALLCLAIVIAAALYAAKHHHDHGPAEPYTPPPSPTAAYPR